MGYFTIENLEYIINSKKENINPIALITTTNIWCGNHNCICCFLKSLWKKVGWKHKFMHLYMVCTILSLTFSHNDFSISLKTLPKPFLMAVHLWYHLSTTNLLFPYWTGMFTLILVVIIIHITSYFELFL